MKKITQSTKDLRLEGRFWNKEELPVWNYKEAYRWPLLSKSKRQDCDRIKWK